MVEKAICKSVELRRKSQTHAVGFNYGLWASEQILNITENGLKYVPVHADLAGTRLGVYRIGI